MTAKAKSEAQDFVTLGKFSAHYGIKGWLKIYSYTEPKENILSYPRLYLFKPGQSAYWTTVEISQGRKQGKGIVAHVKGYDSREMSESLIGSEIAVARSALAELKEGEFYWVDLVGLEVINQQQTSLGFVKELMSTVANDVIVVRNNYQQGDAQWQQGMKKEYLIPYIPQQFVLEVNLEKKQIRVDWDIDF